MSRLRMRITLVLFLLFGTLAVYVYLFRPEPKSSPQEMLNPIFSSDFERLQKLEARRGKDRIVAEKRNDGWVFLSPEKPALRSSERLAAFVETLQKTVKIDDVGRVPGERLEEFGLDQPSGVITLSFESSPQPIVLVLGAKSPAGTRVYARFGDSDRVFLLGSLIDFEMSQLFARVTFLKRSRLSYP